MSVKIKNNNTNDIYVVMFPSRRHAENWIQMENNLHKGNYSLID